MPAKKKSVKKSTPGKKPPVKAKPAASKSKAKTKVKAKAASSKTATVKATPAKVTPAKVTPAKVTPAKVTSAKTSSKPVSAVYDESKIKTLSSLEHIRLRTGMYIGRLGDGSNPSDGIYILLKEIIDNGVDEFIMGNGKHIEVAIKDITKTGAATVKVRDFGRGIPLGKLVDCVSIVNTGGKFNDDVFQFSVGLNGVGTKAVNALSVHFRVVAVRNGEFAEAVFERGKLKTDRKGKLKEKVKDGTLVEFTPDPEIFKEYVFNPEFIEKRMQNYAYLNAGLALVFNGKQFASKRGLYDLLLEETGDDALYTLGYYKGEHTPSGQLEIAFTHTNNYGEEYFSFVNGQYTSDGGTHLSAFKEGFLKGIQTYYKKDFRSEDVREGTTATIAVKLKNPVFESQTKNKLGNSDIRTWIVQEVRNAVEEWLHKNPRQVKSWNTKLSPTRACAQNSTP